MNPKLKKTLLITGVFILLILLSAGMFILLDTTEGLQENRHSALWLAIGLPVAILIGGYIRKLKN